MKKTVFLFFMLILFLGLQLSEQVLAQADRDDDAVTEVPRKLTRHESYDLVYFTEGEAAATEIEVANSQAQTQKNKRSIASVDEGPQGVRKPKTLTTGENLDLQYLFNVRPETSSPEK